jgi:hypothetical protein
MLKHRYSFKADLSEEFFVLRNEHSAEAVISALRNTYLTPDELSFLENAKLQNIVIDSAGYLPNLIPYVRKMRRQKSEVFQKISMHCSSPQSTDQPNKMVAGGVTRKYTTGFTSSANKMVEAGQRTEISGSADMQQHEIEMVPGSTRVVNEIWRKFKKQYLCM